MRTAKELEPLIREQVALGDLAAEEAREHYYRKAFRVQFGKWPTSRELRKWTKQIREALEEH